MTSITFQSGRTYDLDGEHIAVPFANRWDGFEVYSDAVSSGFAGSAPAAELHALQRMTEGTNPTHGSALLLKD